MSTLAEIEAAIENLPPPQFEELANWLERHPLRASKAVSTAEPDFLARAKAVWGDNPTGKMLSELIAETRN